MVNIPSFLTPGFIDTSYNFYFFKNLNFLVGEKNTNNNLNLIDFGAV